jgi:hypothetical protein
MQNSASLAIRMLLITIPVGHSYLKYLSRDSTNLIFLDIYFDEKIPEKEDKNGDTKQERAEGEGH